MNRSIVFAALMLASLAGCKKDPVPTPVPDKETKTVASAAPSASASAKVAIPLPDPEVRKEIPTLISEPVKFEGAEPEGIFLMDDGNLAVVDKLRVGRIVDNDKIEWLKQQVPETNTWVGHSVIYWVGGRWPDAVDVMYKSNNGRALQPTFYPLTGKGNTIVYGEGGGMGDILGVARLGESTLIAGIEHSKAKFATVRGPGVIRGRTLFAAAGCKREELDFDPMDDQFPAIVPRGFGATAAGTVISMGIMCNKRNVSLEVWEKDARLSKFMDLGPNVKDVEYYSAQVIPGKGDEAWLRPNSRFVFRYIEGRIEELPKLEHGAQSLFMSPNGKLYAGNWWGIHRWDQDHWTQVARFAWNEGYADFIADAKEQFWRYKWSVRILREGKNIDMHDACTTPFIHLYDVAYSNKSDYTFPTTRKALASFPEVNDLTLVDFYEGTRRLGVMVKNKAQGEAVIAHLKTSMPKENPRFICYEPKNPRKIDMNAKDK